MTCISSDDGTVVRIAESASGREKSSATEDAAVPVLEVGSTGFPDVEPLTMVTREGRTAFFANCTADHLRGIIAKLPTDFETVANAADAVVEHDPGMTRFPTPELAGLNTGVRRVLGGCGWRRPTSVSDHEAADGFADTTPEEVLRVGAALRGRGWGDWSHDAHLEDAWKTVRNADDESVVVINAHGNDADRLLLASAPFDVLEGAVAVARSTGTDRIIVYASADADGTGEMVREAADAYPSPKPTIEVEVGPEEYRATEPTMALESIEGNHRLEARLRPPGPEEVGLDGHPTLIHTARTFAHLAVSLRNGSPPDTRIVTVNGDIDAPVTIELPETERVRTVLDAVSVAGKLKAACVGGQFGGVTDDLDVSLDPEALMDTDLGTGGTVHLLADDRCVVEFVGRRARFAEEENCGRCVPCREGTAQLTELLRDVYEGDYDRTSIEELIRVMTTSSICTFGVDAGRPARTALETFGSEFRAHADGRCPSGDCFETVEVS